MENESATLHRVLEKLRVLENLEAFAKMRREKSFRGLL